MITKKQYKKIAKGDYGALMDGIEDLINTLNADVFDEGYQSCIADIEVLSTRLADHITDTAVDKGEREKSIFFLEYDELVDTIKNFYKEQLNGK